MSRLKRTLVLWVLGYFEPGRTTAAAHGMCEPFGFHRGVGTPLVPGFPHRFGTRRRRRLFGAFRLFGIHIPLKTMDICGRKVPYVPGVGAQIAGAVPAARVTYSGALQPITSNGHERRYCELVSPAPSAFSFRRRSVRIRCTRFTRSARGTPRRRAISA